MDPKFILPRKENPAQCASFFSKITFFFMIPTFLLTRRTDFNDTDVYEVLPSFNSKVVANKLETEWNIEKTRKRPNIARCLWRTYGLEYSLWLLLYIAVDVTLTLLLPKLTGKIVGFFNPSSEIIDKRSVVIFITLMLGSTLMRAIIIQSQNFAVKQLFLKIRIACTVLVYQKTLKLHSSSAVDSVAGQAITMITKDLSIVDMGLVYISYFIAGIVRIIISTCLIYNEIGPFALFGVMVLLLLLSVQAMLSRKVVSYRLKSDMKTDKRIQLLREILCTLRVIKMYTWESLFCKMVDEVRRKEVGGIQFVVLFKALSTSVGTLAVGLPLSVCITTYVSWGNDISAAKAYTIASCFAVLGIHLNRFIPNGFGLIAEGRATFTRFNRYLLQNEVLINNFVKATEHDCNRVILKDVTIARSKQIILSDINVCIKPGITVVTGVVGSGKTAFLRTLLGELAVVGTIEVSGNISYASQEPWLFPGTIRENIIFTEIYSKSRYEKVLEVCALTQDLESFTLGDKTILRDKGLNLSQGQRCRINLARAVYRSADIYLLDDSLAAVDIKVGKHIFNNCIQNFLRNKVCIIVSDLYSFMSEVEEVILLEKGRVQCRAGSKLETWCSDEVTDVDFINSSTPKSDGKSTKECNSFQNAEECSSLLMKSDNCLTENVYNETVEGGSIKCDVYYKYILAGGCKTLVALIIVLVIKAGADIWTNYSMRFWVDSEQSSLKYRSLYGANSTQYEKAVTHRSNILNQYFLSLVVSAFLVIIRTLIYILFVYQASINIHRVLIQKIILATMSYLDKTLTGNIINRFSRDFYIFDEHLPEAALDTFEALLVITSVLIVVTSVNLWLLVPSATLGIAIIICMYLYLPSGRNIRRVEGLVRNPIIGHIQATFDGLSTIRAWGAQNLLQQWFEKHLDVYNSVVYMRLSALQAFRLYLEILAECYIASVLVILLILKDSVNDSSVGLAITQSFTLMGILHSFLIQASEFEMHITSAERLFAYLKAETESTSGSSFTDSKDTCRIVFKDVSLRYSQNSNMVLRNISFTIEHGERVAIVGRTGAGKSSIILTLFRLYPFDGSIIFNDIDIRTVAINDFRCKISIVPQNPTLFTGSIRTNLDPNSQYTDKELWRALELVEMNNKICSLEEVTSENETSFSVGEKQLICIARATLQNNSIVVFDEATACVDAHTEKCLQGIISKIFINKTVITIAHRLHTVMDYDKILVVDAGTIVECGSPNNLLKNEEGIFNSMVKAAQLLPVEDIPTK